MHIFTALENLLYVCHLCPLTYCVNHIKTKNIFLHTFFHFLYIFKEASGSVKELHVAPELRVTDPRPNYPWFALQS